MGAKTFILTWIYGLSIIAILKLIDIMRTLNAMHAPPLSEREVATILMFAIMIAEFVAMICIFSSIVSLERAEKPNFGCESNLIVIDERGVP